MNLDIRINTAGDAFEDAKRDAWRREARQKAERLFPAEVAALDARIAEKRAQQLAIMENANWPRTRTLFANEAKNFDLLQSYVDEARRKLDALYRKAHSPSGLLV